MTVLIAEDDNSLANILKTRLEKLGIEVVTAGTGQQALNIVKNKIPNLILLDIMLPGGLNGFDVLEQLKKDPIQKDIPVIVLTNLDTERKTAIEIGAVDYIVKPNISLDEVILKIQNNLH
ncbi:MAG TPA: response regulator [Alphaproteobacteria bacterium]|jgi:DNA-binding response OmpR family regulator|nr:response regulator [Alphaproteobacteria bacterium]